MGISGRGSRSEVEEAATGRDPALATSSESAAQGVGGGAADSSVGETGGAPCVRVPPASRDLPPNGAVPVAVPSRVGDDGAEAKCHDPEK